MQRNDSDHRRNPTLSFVSLGKSRLPFLLTLPKSMYTVTTFPWFYLFSLFSIHPSMFSHSNLCFPLRLLRIKVPSKLLTPKGPYSLPHSLHNPPIATPSIPKSFLESLIPHLPCSLHHFLLHRAQTTFPAVQLPLLTIVLHTWAFSCFNYPHTLAPQNPTKPPPLFLPVKFQSR